MPKMTTLLYRVSDALPLAASMEDEKDHRDTDQWKAQAKKIVKQLSSASPPKLSIESGPFVFQCAPRTHFLLSVRRRWHRLASARPDP
jgi:hypothetical protein